MPPKDKGKKGAISGNYKAGKPLKEIMPAGAKAPREGVVCKLEGEPEIERNFDYEPLAPFPEWPGNEEAKNHDFTTGCEKTEEENMFAELDSDGNGFLDRYNRDGTLASDIAHFAPAFAR